MVTLPISYEIPGIVLYGNQGVGRMATTHPPVHSGREIRKNEKGSSSSNDLKDHQKLPSASSNSGMINSASLAAIEAVSLALIARARQTL